jgi:hypothetical protein
LNRPGSPNQIDLIVAVTAELERQGFPDANARQLNAVIEGVDRIVAGFGRPHQPAAAGSGLKAWFASDETGLSSRALARALHGAAFPGVPLPHSCRGRGDAGGEHPHDPSDFGRCLAVLAAEPSLRARLPAAAALSPVWSRLVAAWDELEALYREEAPSGKAPKLFRRLQEIEGSGSAEGGAP